MNDTVFVFPEFKFRYNISNFTNSEEKNSIIGDDIAFFSNKTNLNKKYIEKSVGIFENRAKDEKIFKKFESIREIIKNSTNQSGI